MRRRRLWPEGRVPTPVSSPVSAAAEHDLIHQAIAGELHDCALQLVISAHSGLAESAADAESLADTRRILDEAIAAMRRILDGTPPAPVADQGGLAQGLRTLCAQGAKRAGFVATADIDPRAPGGPYDDLLYLLAREFVENAVKHAHATRVDLTLRVVTDEIELTVADDGRGMSRASPPAGHHGLEFAEHRVQGAGGRLHIDLDRGTKLTIRLPDHRRPPDPRAPPAAPADRRPSLQLRRRGPGS